MWSGVSGQISRLNAVVFQRDKKMRTQMTELRTEMREDGKALAGLDSKVVAVEKTVSEMSAKIENIVAKVDESAAKVDGIDRKLEKGLAELKALLVGPEPEPEPEPEA